VTVAPDPWESVVDSQGMDAPRGSVEFEETDELQNLRRRTYGPDADIAGDAAAQTRLSELERVPRSTVSRSMGGPIAAQEPQDVPGGCVGGGAVVQDHSPVPFGSIA